MKDMQRSSNRILARCAYNRDLLALLAGGGKPNAKSAKEERNQREIEDNRNQMRKAINELDEEKRKEKKREAVTETEERDANRSEVIENSCVSLFFVCCSVFCLAGPGKYFLPSAIQKQASSTKRKAPASSLSRRTKFGSFM